MSDFYFLYFMISTSYEDDSDEEMRPILLNRYISNLHPSVQSTQSNLHSHLARVRRISDTKKKEN